MKIKDKYDVIIAGAGIGGLVCGCTLAKSGMKVLLIEKHARPGGYCSSFRRGRFVFDSCIHYVKLSAKRNLLKEIFDDLELDKYVNFKKLEKSDLVITDKGEFHVYSDINKTIHSLVKLFPQDESKISDFFKFLNTKNTFELYAKTHNKSFADLLNMYFKGNDQLISIFDSLLMNIGLPIHKVHALKAYYFFREFFYTQSHYPMGSMQKIPDALNKIFYSYGGEALYGSKVDKIKICNKRAQGVVVDKTDFSSDYVVSNCDGHSTFSELVERDCISPKLYKRIRSITPSISAYILYVGLSSIKNCRYPVNSSIWYFPNKNFSKIYDEIDKRKSIKDVDYLICSFPSSHDSTLAPKNGLSFSVVLGAPFKTRDYWERNKKILAEKVMAKTRKILTNISNSVEVMSIATPQTLFKFTNNFKGACYGLASIKEQMARSFMPQNTEIQNLFMAGHWTTHGIGQGGLSMAAYSGLSAARNIIRKHRSK